MKIEVIGSGCPTCKKLHLVVEKVVKDEKIDAEVEYSTDITRIVELGLMTSPILVVDGKPTNPKSLSEKDIKEVLCNSVTADNGCCSGGTTCGIDCGPAKKKREERQ